MRNSPDFLKSKTTWAAIATLVGLIGAIATGTMGWHEALQPALIAVFGMFVRDTVAKK